MHGSAARRLDDPPSRPASSSRATLAWALPGAVFVAIAVVLFALAPKGTGLDYAVFHRAGARFLRGEELYRADEFFAFKYAPVAAAFFAPFALLPERVGWLALNLVSAAVVAGVVRWSLVRLGARAGFAAIALLLAMTAVYYGHLLWLGQTDGLVLGLLVASEAQAVRRPWRSGALWALACLVKPPFLTLLLPAVLLRQWRRVGGLVVGTALWLGAGAVRGGLAEIATWFSTLTRSTADIVCWEFNQSVFALSCTYGGGRPGTARFLAVVAVLAVAVLAAGVAVVQRVRRVDAATGSFAATAFALYLGAFLSPLGWNTNLLAAIPLAAAVAHQAAAAPTSRARRLARWAAAAVVVLNCLDFLLLPLHPWDDTVRMLFWYRQYALAGLVLAGAGLGCLLDRARSARLGGAERFDTVTA